MKIVAINGSLLGLLATEGHIRCSTGRRANQEIVPLPLFGTLKRLKPFKRVMVERAREMV